MQSAAANQRTRNWGRGIAIVALAGSLLVGGAGAPAQAASTFKQDFGFWSPVYLTVSLPSSFLAYMEVNPRLKEDMSEFSQLILRPAIGYKLSENWTIWQGYAWVGNYNAPHPPTGSSFYEENRIYQQVNYTPKFGGFKFNFRTRLEERWIEDVAGTAVRFRQMLRGVYPLPMAPEWALVTYDEIFVNLNTPATKGPAAGFDQNRFFVGINRTFSKYFNMDVGYQNQLVNTRGVSGLGNVMNNIILLQFYVTL